MIPAVVQTASRMKNPIVHETMTLDVGGRLFPLNCTDGLADMEKTGFRVTLPADFEQMTGQKIKIGQQYSVVELGADYVIELERHWIAYGTQHVAFSILPRLGSTDSHL